MEEFSFNVMERDQAVIVEFNGDLGMAGVDQLQKVLMHIVVNHPPLTIIDLTRATMLASVSMGAIIAFNGGVKLHGGRTKIVAPKGNVQDSLRRARIDQVISLHETVEAAMG